MFGVSSLMHRSTARERMSADEVPVRANEKQLKADRKSLYKIYKKREHKTNAFTVSSNISNSAQLKFNVFIFYD